MKRTLFLLLALLTVPALAVTSAAETPAKGAAKEAPKPITVPFEMLKSGHMAVQVKINGKGPYRLIFDTGAPITLVNNKLAREAGLLEGAPRPAITLFGSMGEARIKLLEVGGQKAEEVAAIVLDHPTLELLARKVGPLHGIVGFPFFARYRMTIDYEAKTLTFVPSGYKPPDVMKAMVAALMASGNTLVLAPAGQWGLLAGKAESDEEEGIDVKEVVPDSAAEKAGLKKGDRLLTLDGRWTDSVKDLYEAAAHVKPGTSVVAKVRRAGKALELKVAPAAGQ